MLNLLKTQDALKNASDQQLVEQMRSPSSTAPSFLILTEIKRRTDMRKNAGPGGYPEGSLAEEYPMQMMAPQMAQQQPSASQYPMQMATQQPDPMMKPQPAGIDSIGQNMLPARGFQSGGGVFGLGAGTEPIDNRSSSPSYAFDWLTDWLSAVPGSKNFQNRFDTRQQLRRQGINPEGSGVPDYLRGEGIDPNAGFVGLPPGVVPVMPQGLPNGGYDPSVMDAGPTNMTMPQQRRPVAGPGVPSAGGRPGGGAPQTNSSPLGSYEQYMKQAQAMSGNAGGADPYVSVFEQMKALQVDPEKLKSEALSNALMAAGFGMMQSRGNLGTAIGQGGLAGLQAYNQGTGKIREQQMQNLGVEAKIAEAKAAMARGDRTLALELMKEANQSGYRDKTLEMQRQRLGITAAASGQANSRAQLQAQTAMMGQRVALVREVGKRFMEEAKAARERGETWVDDPVAVQRKKAEITNDVMRDLQTTNMSGYGATPSNEDAIIRGLFDDE